MKNWSVHYILSLAAIFSLQCTTQPSHNNKGKGKPDLIILSAEYSEYRPAPVTDWSQVKWPVGGVIIPFIGDIYLTVGNVGTADCDESMFISWTSSESDMQKGHYGKGNRVNEERNPILMGDSVVLKIRTVGLKPGNLVKLLINTDGKPHLKYALPGIDELNYENNTFKFAIPSKLEYSTA